MLKDLVNVIAALERFPIGQLALVAVVVIVLWALYWRINKAPSATATSVDGNRPATLFDLLQLEQEIDVKIGNARQDAAKALSARSAEIFPRLTNCENRLSAIDGGDGRPPPRRRRHPT